MTRKIPLLSEVESFVRKHHTDIIFETMSGEGYERPQLKHLQEVADLVWASGGSDTEIAAAWLHDTVEDTPIKLEEIEKRFGKEIAEIVHGLTDLPEFDGLPIDERKKKQAERVKTESVSVRRIKLADQISNTKFVSMEAPPSWGREHCINYVLGAKKIADNCKGISNILDELFEQEHKRAKERLGI